MAIVPRAYYSIRRCIRRITKAEKESNNAHPDETTSIDLLEQATPVVNQLSNVAQAFILKSETHCGSTMAPSDVGRAVDQLGTVRAKKGGITFELVTYRK